ncbi:hypothetical protein [Mesorhizobium sp.]|uniref:hypothetical protein n=1 Tax=Mesorhizobium sp. TaxID=1871066 RepID=UPI000FE5CD7D|nr:hypothetical protein [Mesorhizobium sp.]RWM84298.1 MAG: hypothetical protein EOR83_16885 [Mesorhizobium sp.]
MHVYRIEHPVSGAGPWQTGAVYNYDSHPRVAYDHSAYDPPGPRTMGEEGTPLAKLFNYAADCDSYVFGFKSKAQLRRWFRSQAGRRAMQSSGLAVLRVYQVDHKHVARGNWQIAFRATSATPVATLDLVTLKPIGNA